MAKKRAKSKTEKLSFDQAASRLDEIVDKLEGGQLELEESLAEYEKGVGLLKQCYAILKQAEQKIEVLTDIGPQGKIETEEFDSSATVMDDTGKTRAKKRSSDKTVADGDGSTLF